MVGDTVAARLVFVHGIGGPRDAAVELKTWTEALAEGARAAGHTRFADNTLPLMDRRFAYYGDLFHRPRSQGNGIDDPFEAEPGDEPVEKIFAEIIDNLLSDEEDPDIRAHLERVRKRLNPQGPAQSLGKAGRDLINAMDAFLDFRPLRKAGRWSSSQVFRGELKQVETYLSRRGRGTGGQKLDLCARNRVLEQTEGGDTVIVAHSLGSVVAYEALHESAPATRLLVTIGSPLVLRTSVSYRLVPTPPRTPEAVSRWLDFWDREDVIAARPIADGLVVANSRGVVPVSKRIRADGLWTHTATKYLSHPAVAGKIVEALMDSA